MYILEMFCWKGKFHKQEKVYDAEVGSSDPKINFSVSGKTPVAPSDEYALFSTNHRYIDLQGAWQEDRRGLLTFAFLGLMYAWQYIFLLGVVVPGIGVLFSGISPMGRPLSTDGYLLIPILVIIWVAANSIFFGKCWRWLRLEMFVQRRLVVRFNRVTRQVHINRPNYAGGLVTFPWQAAVPEMGGSEAGSMAGDGKLLLGWPSQNTGAGFDDLCMIGGALDDRGSAEALWEYIRLYMEEGPDAVPTPTRLRALFPWPWDSVRSTLRFLAPSWRTGDKGLLLTFALLLSPLLLLHSICHWLSLLLCWPTWWPRIMRRAGLPGEPVPKLTTADDYGPEVAAKLRASAIKVVDNPADGTHGPVSGVEPT